MLHYTLQHSDAVGVRDAESMGADSTHLRDKRRRASALRSAAPS